MNYDHEVISVFGYIWGCTTANFQASELCERQKHIEMHRWIACWFVIYKYFIKLKRAILLSAIHTAQHTTIYIPSTHKHTNMYGADLPRHTELWLRNSNGLYISCELLFFVCFVLLGFESDFSSCPLSCLLRSSVSSFSFIPVTFANGLFIWNRTEVEYIKIFIYLLSFGCCCWALLLFVGYFDISPLSPFAISFLLLLFNVCHLHFPTFFHYSSHHIL